MTRTVHRRASGKRPIRRPSCRLALEALEDRTLPSSNQTLATALPLPFDRNAAMASGRLANPNESDLFAILVGTGDVVTARVDAQNAGSTLHSVLRVFDGSGRPIALDSGYGDLDPSLTFQAAGPGLYFLGVSAAGNTNYDPTTRDSGTGQSTGLYTLNVTRVQTSAPPAADVVFSAVQLSETAGLWGDTLTLAYTIDNRGGTDAGAFTASVLLSTTTGFDTTVLPVPGVSISLGGLTADTEASGTVTVTLPGSPGSPPDSFPEPGTVYVGLGVDAGSSVTVPAWGLQDAARHPGANYATLTILQQQAPAQPNGPAAPLGLASGVVGQLGVGDIATYQLDVTEPGRLVAYVHAAGVTTRLELFDGQGNLLVETDGQSAANPDNAIDQHVDPSGAAAVYYLKVEGLSGASGAYSLATEFQPAFSPNQALFGQYHTDVLAWGDFNGDGIPDLAVIDVGSFRNTNQPELRILLGNGDGTFRATQTLALPAGSYPNGMVAGNFGGDGRTDLAIDFEGSTSNPGNVQIFLNNGDGTFQTGQILTFPKGLYPFALVGGDFSGDGLTDLAVADLGAGIGGDVRFFLADGDGTFQTGPVLSLGKGSYPHCLVAGDFANDGRESVAVGSYYGVQVVVNNGDGTFDFGGFTRLVGYPTSLATGDFNGDGVADLAVVENGIFNPATRTYGTRLQVLTGLGGGFFRPGEDLPVGHQPVALVAAELSGNGRLDLAVADNLSNDVRVYLGNGDGTFQLSQTIATDLYPSALVGEDFNADGLPDLAVADFDGGVQILTGSGGGVFQSVQTVGTPFSLVAGDFTGSGRTDLAVVNSGVYDSSTGGYFNSSVGILLGQGDGTFQVGQTLTVGAGPYSLVTGDFNGDGRTDLAVADSGVYNSTTGRYTRGDVRILLGNGDGTFSSGQTILLPAADPTYIVAGDFNGDGIPDLAVAEFGADTVQILLGNGDGTFRRGQAVATDRTPFFLVTGDFVGDGHTDLAVADEYADEVQVLLGDGKGSFRVAQTIPVGKYPTSLVAGHFSNDGHIDLAVADQGSFDGGVAGDVRVLLGDGKGNFTQTGPSLTISGYPLSLTGGDFAGDGQTELAVAETYADQVQILQSDGAGGLTMGQTFAVGSEPRSVVTGDFSGHGGLDVVVANAGSLDVRVLFSNGDGTFRPASPIGPGPAPSRPLVAALSGTGTGDLLVRQQSGTILYRSGVAGSAGAFGPPVIVNPGAPAEDMTVVPTRKGNRVAALDASGNSVTLYALQADGSFRAVQRLVVPGGDGIRIAAGVLEPGSPADLVVATSPGNQLLVYAQLPSGTFVGPVAALPAGGPAANIEFADLTGSGLRDILTSDPSAGSVSVFRNDASQPSAVTERFRAGTGLYDLSPDGTAVQSLEGTSIVLARRLSRTGPVVLLALNTSAETVTLLGTTGVAGGFYDPQVLLNLGFAATQMVATDLTRDGHLDLAFLDPQDDQVVVYKGDGTGRFTRTFRIGAGRDPSGLSVADVNGDGIPDLLVGSQTGDVLILLGNGDGTFRTPVAVQAQRNLALVSFTGGDGTSYFVSANQSDNRVTVQDASGTTTFTAGAGNGLDGPSAVAVADLNSDGLPDLLVTNSSSNELLIFLGTGPGQFTITPLAFPVGTNPAGITVANLVVGHAGIPGNGIPDVIVANEGSNTLTVLFGQGRGSSWTLEAGPQLATGSGPVATVVADVIGPKDEPDGIPDIIVSNSLGNDINVLPGIGLGYFADRRPVRMTTGAGPGPLFLGHFSDAGQSLVTLNLQGDSLSYFENFAGHVSPTSGATATFSSGGANPVAAISGDFRNTGYDDLIVANQVTSQTAVIALFDGGPNGLTLKQTVTVAASGITSLALGPDGSLIIGGTSGVAVEVVALVGSAPSLGLTQNEQGTTTAPIAQPSAAVAVAPALPPAQSSGTAGTSESSAMTGAAMAGTAFDPVAGRANDAPVITLQIAPLTVEQGPSLGEDVAASVLTGAKPTARLLPQRKGSADAPAATLTREEDSGPADESAVLDPDEPLNRVPFVNYGNARPRWHDPAAGPQAKPDAVDRSMIPGQSRLLPPSWESNDGSSAPAAPTADPVAETLALALLASAAYRASGCTQAEERPARP